MAEEPDIPGDSKPKWQPRYLLVMCAVCLGLGFLAGYFLRGSAAPQPLSAAPRSDWFDSRNGICRPFKIAQPLPKEVPTLDDLKRMADEKAEPVLEKLKSDSKNPQLWNQVGLIYKSAHQFKESAGYSKNL